MLFFTFPFNAVITAKTLIPSILRQLLLQLNLRLTACEVRMSFATSSTRSSFRCSSLRKYTSQQDDFPLIYSSHCFLFLCPIFYIIFSSKIRISYFVHLGTREVRQMLSSHVLCKRKIPICNS